MTTEMTLHDGERNLGALRSTGRAADLVSSASDMATVLRDVIEKQHLFVAMKGGSRHVKVEGWCTLATMCECLPTEVSVEERDDGVFVSTVALIRMSDGRELTRASAQCGGSDEPRWSSAIASARRSMATTRATSKVCRIAFAWVMSLAGYSTTPAEEMQAHIDAEPVRAKPRKKKQPEPDISGAFEPKPEPTDDDALVTQSQIENLRAAVAEAGMAPERLEDYLKRLNKRRPSELTVSQYHRLLIKLEDAARLEAANKAADEAMAEEDV